MAITEGVRRLVRAGTRVDSHADRTEHRPAADQVAEVAAASEVAAAPETAATDLQPAGSATAPSPFEPGFADIEAAVALVECGLASRVVLTGFASWPGLLWQAYQLAEAADVLIIPTVVHPGGRVDIAVTRAPRIDG